MKTVSEQQEEKVYSKSELYLLFNTVGGHINDYYDSLLGQLLTTLEAAIEGECQVRALKQRVKMIQGNCFEGLNQDLWGFHNGMSEGDKIGSPQSIVDEMQRIITSYMGNYEGRLINLVGAIVSDDRRLACLTREIRSLVSTIAGRMRRAVWRGSKKIEDRRS